MMNPSGNLYPLQFTPLLKEHIWGSRRLTTLNKPLPPGKEIGESWEIWDQNVVSNGPLAGNTLAGLVAHYGAALRGTRVTNGHRFPLLVKLSATEMNLSVQVHPDDEQALILEPQSGFTGKTEMVYILDAAPDSRVFYGLKDPMTRVEVESALKDGRTVLSLINEAPIYPGDVIFVPAGTIHAYGAGIMYFELQQNSDITYRLYDWDRVDSNGKPRQLHIDKALKVMDFEKNADPKIQPVCLEDEYGRDCFLAACRYFLTERLELSGALLTRHAGESFHILCCIGGTAVLSTGSGVETQLQMQMGDTVLVPASITEYNVEPGLGCVVLRSTVPDLKEVAEYLLSRGLDPLAIAELGGSAWAKNDLRSIVMAGR